MIIHDIQLPPEYTFPIDDWKLIHARFEPHLLAQTETIFALGNGYLGMRGTFEEGTPVFQKGTFVNAFYESWPIVYGEEAYGFAKTGQTIVNVTDSQVIKLYVDDEPFYLPTASLLQYERRLDMQAGTLDREVLWETPSGKHVSIHSRRLVSFPERHLAAISYEVTVLNAKVSVVIVSEIGTAQSGEAGSGDPRQARGFQWHVLQPRVQAVNDRRIVLSHVTHNSNMTLACGIEHTIDTACPYSYTSACAEDAGQVVFSLDAQPGVPIHLTKYMTYHTSRSAPPDELCARAARTLDRAVGHGFAALLADQQAYMDDFWQRSDIQVQNDSFPRTQQCVRWNVFQLLQASGRAEGTGIPAKGLTGQAYEGHYFWDTEIYVLPFLIYTAPRIAKNLLKFRHSMLHNARRRAREVNQEGMLFPWRTINGEEASAYYAAGTAQYHINADIMYGLRKYVEVTGDEAFLYAEGAEMLVETARLWYDLGFFSARKDGKFCIHGVTGPDEYNTVVNNNTYTNLMARENLRYAAATVQLLRREQPERYAILVDQTRLQEAESDAWHQAAEHMYIPFDAELEIHPQDDDFLDKERWDFEQMSPDKYPLLLHYHPLVIYRSQVIKQVDVVMAMFLLGQEFSLPQKQRNFDYYDPLTTGDSSLSACVQSIMASEIGYTETAMEYARYALLMDLGDIAGNVKDGCHVASIGGSWMVIVYGLAGMRDYGGRVSFQPRLPTTLQRLRFPLTIRGQRLAVEITPESTTYLLEAGSELVITHVGEDIELTVGVPVSVTLQPSAG